jgi:hypothetical protein
MLSGTRRRFDFMTIGRKKLDPNHNTGLPAGASFPCSTCESVPDPGNNIRNFRGQLDIPSHAMAIIQVFLAKHVLHMFLLCEDDGMVDCNHEPCQHHNYRV